MQKEKILNFTPFSEAEAKELLLNKSKLIIEKQTKIKINSWFNGDTLKYVYGLSYKDIDNHWYMLSIGNRALIFENRKVAKNIVNYLIDISEKEVVNA